MALLTKEQIEEIDMMRFRFNEHHFKYELEKWNEKQLSVTQFEPDWSTAPKYVVGAALNLAWVSENGNWALGYQIAKYDRPASVITPHPHSEMMTKYSEVATRRVDPWMEFERYNHLTGSWDRLDDHPSWRPNAIYHYLGDTK